MHASSRLALGLAILALPATPALAAGGNASNGSGNASAAVVTPITLTHTVGAALRFGKFTSGTGGGTVVITAAGNGTATSDVNFVPGSTVSADNFTVRGDASRSLSVTTGSGAVGITGAYMAFTTTPSASALTLNTSGNGTISVGGTLTVLGNMPTGSFTGTYAVTVTYN